jgi:hypothetical protein
VSWSFDVEIGEEGVVAVDKEFVAELSIYV